MMFRTLLKRPYSLVMRIERIRMVMEETRRKNEQVLRDNNKQELRCNKIKKQQLRYNKEQ